MSILTLDVGGSNISVQCQRGGHGPPRRVGSAPIDADGGETSSVRAELMVVPVILAYLTASEVDAIRALFALGAQVDCQGDIFNNGNAVVTCSGTFSDDLRENATDWELSLTLYEIGTALGGGGGGSTTTPVFLGSDTGPSGSDPGTQLASPDGDDLVSGWAYYEVFPSTSAPTCPGAPDTSVSCSVVTSGSPEKIWMTDDLAAARLSGVPRVVMNMNGGTGSTWATQAVYLKVVVVRSGVDVASFQTDWSPTNGGFAGADVTLTGTTSILIDLQDGDRLRFELYARMAIHQGFSDDGVHQAVGYGYLGGGVYLSTVFLGGLVQKLAP